MSVVRSQRPVADSNYLHILWLRLDRIGRSGFVWRWSAREGRTLGQTLMVICWLLQNWLRMGSFSGVRRAKSAFARVATRFRRVRFVFLPLRHGDAERRSFRLPVSSSGSPAGPPSRRGRERRTDSLVKEPVYMEITPPVLGLRGVESSAILCYFSGESPWQPERWLGLAAVDTACGYAARGVG